MPFGVSIKPDKYGSAIGLLLRRGGSFQTRYKHILIVNADQKKALQEAGFVEAELLRPKAGGKHGQKKDAG